jgi:tetratricopeptide (TPR) repeat protein
MLELRRRVQADPASIAFAQLAEECRRIGNNDEAVSICRAGLASNPAYLSARVTLGRALIELGHLDEAMSELDLVVAGVPNNLAAIRGLAEIYQRRGQMPVALEYYRRALELAKHDPDLEDTVERISQAVAPAPPPRPATPPIAVEDLFDFDSLIQQLAPDSDMVARVPEVPGVLEVPTVLQMPDVQEVPWALAESEAPVPEVAPEVVPSVLDEVVLEADDTDSLAIIERELRELDSRPPSLASEPLASFGEVTPEADAVEEQAAREQAARAALARRRHEAQVAVLEGWLAAIVADRHHRA